ncbi:TetR/AcrR family transcriptional regulator [Actinomadura graeca]|uniref:TetR/AcrR family transcriptional regulator n=1 Tax=Actinomadura graeca TaxID=2750812 RepID=UPI001E53D902|nr:TetR/AcrR family transcriptional regulator [Actinomadura graeca]
MEDVAKAAGVSTATAYNHFRTKQSLIGYAYSPLLKDLIEAADQAIKNRYPPIAAIREHILDLSLLARTHRDLTLCLIAAMQEQSQKTGSTITESDDVRRLAPLSEPLVRLISYGQDFGAVRPDPSAADTGVYHTSALLFRVLSRPHESAEDTAAVTLSQLLPALVSESDQPEWSPEDDLSLILKRLTGVADAPGAPAEDRRRLANHPLTKDYLEAGFRLLVHACEPGDREGKGGGSPSSSMFFDFLTAERIIEETAKGSERDVAEDSFHDRWLDRDAYVSDVLAYSLWIKNWLPHTVAADKARAVIANATDLADAAHEACYQDQVAGLHNPALRLAFIAAVIAEHHPELKESLSAVYQSTQEKWIPIYRQIFLRHSLRLRPDVSIRDIADIFTALSDGFILRMHSDSAGRFIDHDRRSTMLGKAIMAVVLGSVAEGEGEDLESAFRQLTSAR